MPTYSPLTFTPILELVRPALPTDMPVYLVGGAVRDAFLSRPVHDLDFVLPDHGIKIARRVANKLQAAFFPLDEEHDTGRVILTQPSGQRFVLDFSNQRGPDLESDLRARDFTINAIAVDVFSFESLFDPLGGVVDLREKRLRACSTTSFINDPLRILRGVRLATLFGFRIVPDTFAAMRGSVSQIERVSSERIRDELFRIFDGPSPDTPVRALDILDILAYVLPELRELKGIAQSPPHVYDVWEHSLGVLKKLEEILTILAPEYDPQKSASQHAGSLTLRLGRYRKNFHDHLSRSFVPDRNLRSILFFSALFHDVGKPKTRQVDETGRIRFFNHARFGAELFMERGKVLRLSNQEISWGEKIISNHLRPILLAQSGKLPSRKAIFRFFQDSGAAGVDTCLLSLADIWATYGAAIPQDVWLRQLDVVRAMLEAWWEHPQESISPQALLSGDELMQELDLKPGPVVGQILAAIKEAQAIGKVRTKDEALAHARALLQNS